MFLILLLIVCNFQASAYATELSNVSALLPEGIEDFIYSPVRRRWSERRCEETDAEADSRE